MKKMIAALCLLLAASPLAMAQGKSKDVDVKAVPAVAKAEKEPSAKQKAQQERMKSCNKEATGKKGDARKKFMSACLKGKTR